MGQRRRRADKKKTTRKKIQRMAKKNYKEILQQISLPTKKVGTQTPNPKPGTKKPYFEALEMFNELMEEINSFDLPVQKKGCE